MNPRIMLLVGSRKLGQYTAIRTNVVRTEAPRSRGVMGKR